MQYAFRSTSMMILLVFVRFVGAQTTNVYFDVDDSTLTSTTIKSISTIMFNLEAAPGIRVVGYTDADGVNDDNYALSDARARMVTQYLIDNGIPTTKIVSFGNGETMAKQSNATAYDKQLDRRVEIEVLSETEFAMAKKLGAFKTPERFKVQPIKITFDPTKPNDISVGTRGTVLHIPANTFVDAGGKKITAPVTIEFTEYATAGEMVFSGIPMHYNTGTEQQRFSSSGMFKIEGYSGGLEVNMAPNAEMTMDYAMVGEQSNIGFYTLDKNGEWKLLNKIGDDGKLIELNASTKSNAKTQELKQVKADSATAMQFANAFNNNMSTVKTERVTGSVNRVSVPASLKLSGFGYYNCDVLKPMAVKVNITGDFVDEHGKPVQRINNITVVDLKLNGAFYYTTASHIEMDSRSENMIFVSNQANRIFYISNADLKKMQINKSGTYQIHLQEITKTVTTNDQMVALIQSYKSSK